MLDDSVKILGHVEAALKLLESNDAATAAGTRRLLIKALRNLEREPAGFGNETHTRDRARVSSSPRSARLSAASR